MTLALSCLVVVTEYQIGQQFTTQPDSTSKQENSSYLLYRNAILILFLPFFTVSFQSKNMRSEEKQERTQKQIMPPTTNAQQKKRHIAQYKTLPLTFHTRLKSFFLQKQPHQNTNILTSYPDPSQITAP